MMYNLFIFYEFEIFLDSHSRAISGKLLIKSRNQNIFEKFKQEDACLHHDLRCENPYNENVTLDNSSLGAFYRFRENVRALSWP